MDGKKGPFENFEGQADFMVRVLGVVAAADSYDQLFWRCDGTYAPVTFFINCSDVFDWGTADAEPVTPSTVDELVKAFADVATATGGDNTFAATLYACRRRASRPQGAAYPSDSRLWPLFDECGPPRVLDLDNPAAAPSVVEGR